MIIVFGTQYPDNLHFWDTQYNFWAAPDNAKEMQ